MAAQELDVDPSGRTATDPGGSERSEDPSAPAGRGGRRWPGPVWWFPIGVVVVAVVLTALGVSGTSVARLGASPGDDPSLIAGTPQVIRSDEWNTRTPIVAGQVEDGLPRFSDLGVGEHDLAVLYDLPTNDWTRAFRPHLWAYGVLPLGNAFAFEWWAISAALLIGSYALVLAVVRDWRWAVVGALVTYGSPFFHWWYITQLLAPAGYAAGAGAALLAALRAGGPPWRRWALTGVAAFLTLCFVMPLYPPFQVPIAIAVVGLLAGVVVGRVRRGELPWRRLVETLVVAGAAVGVVLVAYALTRVDALRAVSGTAYPGTRRIQGGDGSVLHLATGWFGWSYLRDGARLGPVFLGNESEASSFVTLGVFLVPALPFVWAPLFGRGARYREATIGLLLAMGLLLAHAYVGLPTWLTRITLLDRVQTNRALVGTGMASILLLVVVGASLDGLRGARGRRRLAGVAIVLVTVGYVVSLGQHLRDLGAPLGIKSLAGAALVAAVVAGLYFWRPLVSMVALAAFGLFVSVPVNPLYRGLDPLHQQPLVDDLAAADSDGGGDWLSTNGDVTTVLVANGYDPLSGVNLYPDADAWRVLDPDGSDEETWNRYAHTVWALVPDLAAPQITLLAPDVVSVVIDPCAPELDQLGVGHVATDQPVDASCLTLDRTTTTERGATVYLYDRASG